MQEKILNIKIISKASKNEIIKDNDNEIIKIKVTSLPVNNEANKKIIKILSKEYKTGKSNIEIIKGKNNKNKIIKILFKK